jgi:hypothetical protein
MVAAVGCAGGGLAQVGGGVSGRGDSGREASAAGLGPGFLALYGPWKFRVGDSPVGRDGGPLWAEASFDDAGWEDVDLSPKPGVTDPFNGAEGFVPGWNVAGHSGSHSISHVGYIGWAWYRLRVPLKVEAGQRLAMVGPLRMTDAYQVYANGRLLGGLGDFGAGSSKPNTYFTHPVKFDLAVVAPEVQTIAFRVWMGPVGLLHEPDSGGLNFAPLLGEPGAIEAQYQLQWQVKIRELTYPPIEALLLLFLALVLAGLMFFDRSDPVYLWAAGILVIAACADIALVLAALTTVLSSRVYFIVWEVFIIPLYLAGWVMVWWHWFRIRKPVWVPKAIAVLTLVYMSSEALRENFLFFGEVSTSLGLVFKLLPAVVRLVFLAFTVMIVVSGIRKQGREGWLVLLVIVPLGLALFTSELIVLHLPVLWHPFGYDIFVGQIADLFLVVALTVLLLRRLLLTLHKQQLAAQELKHAREMQQVLIPEVLPEVPGYVVTSAYRPALEVGGDFFQVIPLGDGLDGKGSTLIVLGDVSGKGLRAAMAVSLVVGMVRALVHAEVGPGELLTRLNERLCGHLQGGFATCVALRVEAGGECVVAAAGHPSPYLDGEELVVPAALPLGLVTGIAYEELAMVLPVGTRLVLYSDGLLEARNASGVLYGFERMGALLAGRPSAGEAADAAVAFGQDDDVTVLTLGRG